MSNSLQGQINEDTLTSLLQFLAMNHNSGCLKLKQPGMEAGEIFFEKGQIIHASFVDMFGVEALAYFLTWTKGRFIFRNGAFHPPQTINISLESALLEAAYQADTYEQPPNASVNIYAVLKSRSLKEQTLVSLSFGALNLLRELDGKHDLASIAQKLGWSHERMLVAAGELLQQNLVEVYSEDPLSSSFIDELGQLLVYMMGPIGEFVIDDALVATGTSRDSLTKPLGVDVLQEIYNQLDQENWRMSFQEQAEKICQKYGIVYKMN